MVLLFSMFFSMISWSAERWDKATKIDALLAKVGREAITISDLDRFKNVDSILLCVGSRKRDNALPTALRALLDVYIEEELIYQEARTRKIPTLGMIPETVKAIHANATCKAKWQNLGADYAEMWRTETRPREGQGLLVRELEKRILVDKFRKTELVGDTELWKREVKARYPVKIYLE